VRQREPALAGLEPAHGRDRHARALRHLGEGQPPLEAQLAQARLDAQLELGVLCRHGKELASPPPRPSGWSA
jgi:hypothetical protein